MIPISLLEATQVPRPDPLPLAGPSWLFTLLLLLTFFLHVLPMNLVIGGSIVAAAARLKARGLGEKSHYFALARLLARILPVSIAFAITFGVATLLFAQVLYGRLLYTSSILMGWYWFAVIPILVLAYYGAYFSAFKEQSSHWKGFSVTAFSALLFLLIAFIYSNNMSLMLHPETFLGKYTARPGGLSMNLADATLPARYLHMVMGALAVTGLFTAVVGLVKQRQEVEFGIWAVRHGLLLFSGATALNMTLGTWFLLSFSPDVLLVFMRNHPLGMASLAFGIIFGLATLGCGVLALHSKQPDLFVKGATATLIFTLSLMLLLRDQIRQAALASVHTPALVEIPQWTAILLFLFLLAASLVTIFWMVNALYSQSLKR